MFRKLSRKKLTKISIIPLIDIIFLMLVFFMLATNFDDSKVVNFKVEKNTGIQDNKSKSLVLNIKKNDFKINDKIFSKKEIENEIIKKWSSELFASIIILNDDESKLEYLIFILDILKKNKINKVIFSDEFNY